jgi:superfamily I DNA/RNA helicase
MAVQATEPDVLVIAGPGSGKTTVIQERVNYLIESGVDPDKIVVITFTRKAAGELEDRIEHPLNFVGTLHSYLYRYLNEIKRTAILDPKTEEELRAQHLKDCNAKPSDIAWCDWMSDKPGTSKAERVTWSYFRKLFDKGYTTFDGVIMAAKTIMARTPPIEHLIVDEYQDSSVHDRAAHDAIPAKNRFYVGDPRQVVYEWRGVDPKMMLEKHCGTIYHLNTNYRCGKQIVEISQRIAGEEFNSVGKEANIQVVSTLSQVPVDPARRVGFVCRYNADVESTFNLLTALGHTPKVQVDQSWVSMALDVLLGYASPSHHNIMRAIRIAAGQAEENRILKECSKACQSAAEVSPWHKVRVVNGTKCDDLPLWVKFIERQKLDVRAQLRSIEKQIGPLTVGGMVEYLCEIENGKTQLVDWNGVHVMTVHQSKGLEFDDVVIVNATESGFPLKRGGEAIRLLFVAVTRARENLFIHAPDGEWSGMAYFKEKGEE